MIHTRRQARLMAALLTIGLASSLALNMPAPAKKAEAGAPAAEASAKPDAKRKAPETKPALDEEARKAIEAAASKLDPDTRTQLNKLAESMQLENRAIYNELRDEEELSLAEVGMLWQAAVERSGTIRYAIEKLSRRDATGKPVENDSFSKRMVQNLVHLGGVAGSMWTGTPAGLIGSNMVQDIINGSPDESALTRVTDADMVILAKEVEALQAKLIEIYYNYRHAKERWQLAQEATSTIARYYDRSQEGDTPEALQPLMNSLYESARQDEQNAQQAYQSARSELALLVGPDAVAALEQAGNKASAR